MSQINFPNIPSDGDEFLAPNGTTYQYDSDTGQWKILLGPGADGPKGPIGPEGATGSTGPDGPTGATGTDATRITGEIIAFGGTTVPSGWLECNGQAAPSALAAVLGISNVPDLRGEFIRGFDNGRGVDSGRAILTAQGDEFESHTHIQNSHNHTQNPHTHQANYTPLTYVAGQPQANGLVTAVTALTNISTNTATNIAATATNQSTGGTETRPRNISLMYIIKT
ncbi:tail collar domain protein [Synechococcus phage ACG-2014f]|uniref:Tail collar domain protein n=1 Tax=Synechococcus phage ACG-2014f TaxID=1493511 RepID=A0A0E3G487_9CAUD|nr:tail collar domain protein [Synechococcus phage ACG-2014f]AIX42486.1 tail collar domain protein [Synechococcus phage ACG-2014f]AIX43905.1 tail collar domain protein [Synechococcus phage ACG-2014f]